MGCVNSAGPIFSASSWAKLEPAFNEHIQSYQTAAMSASQRESHVFVDVFVFIFSGFVFEDEKIGKEVKLKK